ncbi:MAG: asparagine synthase (glutamine-hydrolyzing) [Sedimentisphaerales bacterium]|nr:asparagine synthase (glutamine-hydrolyzing) [Sedimentisphaerales bacterium]
MCGIAGFNWPDRGLIEAMNRAQRHRGPDDEGVYLDDAVSLGHRRLSILDLSDKGHQPMAFEDLVLVYNGEIYNYRPLRTELEAKGYRFVSGTDTEVVLYAYHAWGASSVERFNGMWALAIYDRRDQSLFLSRDRFGIKPLYYYFDGKRFLFASELKALRQAKLPERIDPAGMNFYFYQKYIGRQYALFEDFHKLSPGENLRFDLAGRRLRRSSYYDLAAQTAAATERPTPERLAAVEELLADAVEQRLVADVPVGGFLSGGVDSSLISALIARRHADFQTFSVGFTDDSYDESGYARRVAAHLGTDHYLEYLTMDESLLERVLGCLDEPFGDASVLPTYLLAEMTRRRVTVALSGDGGDEVFAGYDTYQAYRLARLLPAGLVRAAGPLARLLGPSDRKLSWRFKLQKFTDGYAADPLRRHLDWMGTFTDPSRRRLLGQNFLPADRIAPVTPADSLSAVQDNDLAYYLPEDILKKVDAASMAHSLEVRVPLLDYRLVPLVLSLPDRYKIRCRRSKWLLKRIAARYLPGEIVHRKKRGFTVPIGRWIRQGELIREYLTQRRNFDHGLLDFDYAQGLLADHDRRRRDNARPLWLIFVWNYWWRRAGAVGGQG